MNLAYDLRVETGDLQGIAIVLVNLGEVERQKNNYFQAKSYVLQALDIAQEVKYTDLQSYCHDQLFEIYLELDLKDSARFHNDLKNTLKDSLLNLEKISSLAEMEVKFETEKLEREKLIEEQKRTNAELELLKRNRWILFLVGAMVLIILLSIIYIQRRNRKLAEEKAEAIEKERERGLQAIFDATESERQRIAKDLHDSVGQQMSGIKLAWSNIASEIKGHDSERINQISKILDQTADEIREISHRMMPKALEEFGIVVAVEQMLEKSFSLSKIKYEFDTYNIDSRLNTRIELSLYRITQELINNVIKHSEASLVSVQIFIANQHLILIIEDNGKGLSEEPNDGHGMLNIRSRLNTINGEVNFEGSTKSGTLVTVRIKL